MYWLGTESVTLNIQHFFSPRFLVLHPCLHILLLSFSCSTSLSSYSSPLVFLVLPPRLLLSLFLPHPRFFAHSSSTSRSFCSCLPSSFFLPHARFPRPLLPRFHLHLSLVFFLSIIIYLLTFFISSPSSSFPLPALPPCSFRSCSLSSPHPWFFSLDKMISHNNEWLVRRAGFF